MKILLIRPPSRFGQGSIPPVVSLPLGLLSVAAVLEAAGHRVVLYDALVESDGVAQDAGDGFLHLGATWQEVEDRIRSEKPALVGISCLFTAQLDNALHVASLVKRTDPGIVTVMGGAHPTVRPLDCFTEKAVDAVCRGEGEETLLALVRRLEKGEPLTGLAGTVVRGQDGVLVEGPARPLMTELDLLPFPAYHLVDPERYFRLFSRGLADRPGPGLNGSARVMSVITSRGCPFNCSFCSVHLHMGRRWRPHSAEYVLRHLHFLKEKYQVSHFHFEDDNISCNPERFGHILGGLATFFPAVTWDTPNGVRVDTLTKDLVARCVAAGCTSLTLGIESGSQEVLDTIIEKRLRLENVDRVVRWCSEADLDVNGFFIIGFPGETRAQMEKTVRLALRLQASHGLFPHLFVATPLPGTRLERICLERGLIPAPLSPGTLARMTQGGAPMEGDTFTAAEIVAVRQVFFRGFRNNFLRGVLRLLIRRPGLIPACTAALLRLSRRMSLKSAVLHTFDCPRYLGRSRGQPRRG